VVLSVDVYNQAVDNETPTSTPNPQPFKVDLDDLSLRQVQREATWPCAVQFIDIPIGLIDRLIDYTSCGVRSLDDGCYTVFALQEKTIVVIEVTNLLRDVVSCIPHDESHQDQMGFGRLVIESPKRLASSYSSSVCCNIHR
jgi:hypothetical protein